MAYPLFVHTININRRYEFVILLVTISALFVAKSLTATTAKEIPFNTSLVKRGQMPFHIVFGIGCEWAERTKDIFLKYNNEIGWW